MNITFEAENAVLSLTSRPPVLTAGMQETVRCTVTFGQGWSGLYKSVSFMAVRDNCVIAKIVRTPEDWNDDAVTVPPEVLAKPCDAVYFGVQGASEDGVILPTVWCKINDVKPGCDLDGDNSAMTPAAWAELISKIGNLDELNTSEKETIVTAINEAANRGYSIRKIKDFVYEAIYSDIDYEAACEYFANFAEQPGACSAVRNGKYYGRNLDWIYNNQASFVVRVPRIGDRLASIAICGGFDELTENFVRSGNPHKMYKMLPFHAYDGINEAGLVCNMNVVPLDKGNNRSVPRYELRESVSATMLVRYILDRFASAQEAAEHIKNYVEVYFPEQLHEMGYELHFLIADETDTICLEFVNNEAVLINIEDHPYLTNFYQEGVTFFPDYTVLTPETQQERVTAESFNHITAHGSGLERHNLIAKNYTSANTKEGMRALMNLLRYTRAYASSDDPANPAWLTEYVGKQHSVSTPAEDYANVVAEYAEVFEKRNRDDQRTWQTVHSAVYNIAKRTMNVIFQEDGEEIEFALDEDDGKESSLEEIVSYTDKTDEYSSYYEAESMSPSDYFKRLSESSVPIMESGLYFVRSSNYGDAYARMFNPQNGFASLEIIVLDMQYGHQHKMLYWLENASWALVKGESNSEEAAIVLNNNGGEGTHILNVGYPGTDLSATNKLYVDSRVGTFPVTLQHDEWTTVGEGNNAYYVQNVETTQLPEFRDGEDGSLLCCATPESSDAMALYNIRIMNVTWDADGQKYTLEYRAKQHPAENENINCNMLHLIVKTHGGTRSWKLFNMCGNAAGAGGHEEDQPGGLDGAKINGVGPGADGNYHLTAENLGAAPSTLARNVTKAYNRYFASEEHAGITPKEFLWLYSQGSRYVRADDGVHIVFRMDVSKDINARIYVHVPNITENDGDLLEGGIYLGNADSDPLVTFSSTEDLQQLIFFLGSSKIATEADIENALANYVTIVELTNKLKGKVTSEGARNIAKGEILRMLPLTAVGSTFLEKIKEDSKTFIKVNFGCADWLYANWNQFESVNLVLYICHRRHGLKYRWRHPLNWDEESEDPELNRYGYGMIAGMTRDEQHYPGEVFPSVPRWMQHNGYMETKIALTKTDAKRGYYIIDPGFYFLPMLKPFDCTQAFTKKNIEMLGTQPRANTARRHLPAMVTWGIEVDGKPVGKPMNTLRVGCMRIEGTTQIANDIYATRPGHAFLANPFLKID